MVNGFPFVSPGDLKSLQDKLPEDLEIPSEYMHWAQALNQPILNFEQELLVTLKNN